MRLTRLCLLSLALACSSGSHAADIPPLNSRVTDLTGTLDAIERQSLESTLAAHEEKTTNQIAVLMIPTTGEESMEQYAVRVFEQWKLGQKGKDNGVLFVIAKDDRKMRIEVGYGLEGAIPDVVAARIIRERVAPRFRQGDYDAGINEGIVQLIAAANGELPDWEEQEPTSSSDSKVATPAETKIILVWPSLVILTFILIFSGSATGGRVGEVVMGFGLAAFFGTFIACGMMIFALNGSWPQMQWWWQYLPTIALGLLFSGIGVGKQVNFSKGGGSNYSGSSSSFSSSSSSSSSSSFSGDGGSSGGGGASGSW